MTDDHDHVHQQHHSDHHQQAQLASAVCGPPAGLIHLSAQAQAQLQPKSLIVVIVVIITDMIFVKTFT